MPLLQRLALAALPAALLGLAACDRGPATVTLYMHPTGSFDSLIAATRNEGPLYMELDGEPFATGEDLEGPIGAAMEPAVQTRVQRLPTALDAADDPAFRQIGRATV